MAGQSEVRDQFNATGATAIGFGDTGNSRDYMSQGFIPTMNTVSSISFETNGKSGSSNIGIAIWIDTADANSAPLGAVAAGVAVASGIVSYHPTT